MSDVKIDQISRSGSSEMTAYHMEDYSKEIEISFSDRQNIGRWSVIMLIFKIHFLAAQWKIFFHKMLNVQ